MASGETMKPLNAAIGSDRLKSVAGKDITEDRFATAAHAPSNAISTIIEQIADKFELCRNRVWEISKSVEVGDREELLRVLSGVRTEDAGRHEGHDQCAFDFCEYSRLDYTSVPQRHESVSCARKPCGNKVLDTSLLTRTLYAGQGTAWNLTGTSVVEWPRPYMAISHVWSDGTGAGAWPHGQVNECLYTFFTKIASDLQCEGIWWDAICIPKEKAARSKAILNMQRNYENSRVTLVHDCFLRQWVFKEGEPDVACFAIGISPWFSRGWTALELARSRKVKVMFKGGLIKDLDEDILAKCSAHPGLTENGPFSRHVIVSRIIKALRDRGISSLNRLLETLGSRYTSWPRDVAIIAGQLVGINVRSQASQQETYQEVIKRIGNISHGHLFHNSVTMSDKGFTWCPTSIFNIPTSSDEPSLVVREINGDVIGKWNVFHHFNALLEERYNWQGIHPLVEAGLKQAIKGENTGEHFLLVNCGDGLIRRGLLVKVISNTPTRLYVRFVGPLHFQPPVTRAEFGEASTREVTIAGAVGRREEDEQAGKREFLSLCAEGNQDKILLTNPTKSEINAQDEEGNRPLHLLAGNGLDRAVEWLLRNENFDRTNLNLKNKEGCTPLHLAARDGHGIVVSRLLQHGADPNPQNNNTWTPLHYAAWGCYEKVVSELLGVWDEDFGIQTQDRLGQNALHLAAERGNEKIISMLLPKMADTHLQALCYDKQTVLHRAALGGSAGVVKLLMERLSGYNLNTPDNHGRTPLHVAAMMGQEDVVELFTKYTRGDGGEEKKDENENKDGEGNKSGEGDDVDEEWWLPNKEAPRKIESEDRNGMTALLLAVRNGYVAAAQRLLDAGADIESRGDSGRTPLMWAAESGWLDMAEVLLSAGATTNSIYIDNQTPLSWAAENGHVAMAELLLEHGADIDFKVAGVPTPLARAAEKGHDQVVKAFLKRKVDLEAVNGANETPLLTAINNGHEKVVRLLLQEKVDLERGSNSFYTPLHAAIRHGHVTIMKMLLEKGAEIKPTSRLHYDNSTLSAAVDSGQEEAFRMLLDMGTANTALQLWTPWVPGTERKHLNIARILLERGVRMPGGRGIGQWLRSLAEVGEELTLRLFLDRLAQNGSEPDPDQLHLALLDAVRSGHAGTMKLLVERGAIPTYNYVPSKQPNLKRKKEHDPLRVAFNAKVEVGLKFLLERGAVPEPPGLGADILQWAMTEKHMELAKLLLEKGTDPKLVGKGSALVKAAAIHGDIELVEMLFDKGAKIIKKKGQELSPLMEIFSAADSDEKRPPPAVLELLLKKGVKRPGKLQERKLMLYAIRKGAEGVGLARQLLRNISSDYNDINDSGIDDDPRSLMNYAVEVGNLEVVKMMVRYSSAWKMQYDTDGERRGLLFYAVPHIKMVKFLLIYNHEMDWSFWDCKAALSRAAALGYRETVKVFTKIMDDEDTITRWRKSALGQRLRWTFCEDTEIIQEYEEFLKELEKIKDKWYLSESEDEHEREQEYDDGQEDQ